LIRINLLPRVPRRRLISRQWVEIGLPVVVLVASIILSIWIVNQNSGLRHDIAGAQKEIAELQPIVARVLDLDRRIAALREQEKVILDLLKQQLPAASVLNEVRLLIPKDAWLTGLNVPEPSGLSIEGFALTYPAVAQLMDNLRAGRLFRQVDLTVAQVERIGARGVVKFSVTARIERPQAAGGDRP
jgi:Tfp pilus assembly protein PilN